MLVNSEVNIFNYSEVRIKIVLYISLKIVRIRIWILVCDIGICGIGIIVQGIYYSLYMYVYSIYQYIPNETRRVQQFYPGKSTVCRKCVINDDG